MQYEEMLPYRSLDSRGMMDRMVLRDTDFGVTGDGGEMRVGYSTVGSFQTPLSGAIRVAGPLAPMAWISLSAARVETPLTYASWMVAAKVLTEVRRGSRKLGRQLPSRSLGMSSGIVPTRVSQSRRR